MMAAECQKGMMSHMKLGGIKLCSCYAALTYVPNWQTNTRNENKLIFFKLRL